MNVPNPIENDLKNTYTEDFFKQHMKNIDSFKKLAEFIKTKTNSVLDYGCGHGLLVEMLNVNGVDAYGLEGSESAKPLWNKDNLHKYQIMDFTKEIDISSIPKTESVYSTEVAEHLPESSAENFVKIMVIHKPKYIFFSAATSFQDLGGNPSHINEQPFNYWLQIFNKYDYDIDISETYELKMFFLNNMNVFANCWWYPKNMIILRHKSEINLDIFKNFDIKYTFTPKIIPNHPVFKLVFERDFFEYKNIVLLKFFENINKK